MMENTFEQNSPKQEPVQGRIEQLKEKIYSSANTRVKLFEMSVEFAKKLQTKYPDCERYKCFHQLIGSTPPENTIEGDFTGDDSVERFLKTVADEAGIGN